MAIHQAYNILIIDDDDLSQKFTCHALQNQHSTICAGNGEQGLELARHHHPDIIILDVHMPGLNGYEVCDRLKQDESTRDIPVVFLSSFGEVRDRMQGYEAGGDDYLVKPFVPEDLLAKVNVLSRYHGLHDEMQNQIEEARKTALMAMNGNNELGQAMVFVEQSYTANNYEELAARLLSVLKALGLKASIFIAGYDEEHWFSTTGNISPLESELMLLLRQDKRFYDFGCRTQINYPHCSLLIKNMPLQDMERYGRIKDFLPPMLGAADQKIKALNSELALRQQSISLTRSFDAIKDALSTLNTSLHQNQQKGASILHEMVEDLAHSLPKMGLEEDQEVYIINRIDNAVVNTMDVVDAGESIGESFASVLGQLQSLIDNQAHLVETFASNAGDGDNGDDHSADGYAMDVELF
jgi:DNA-binding response OmpR family regulator